MAANKTKPLLTGTLVPLSAYVVFRIATWVNRSLDGGHPGAAIEADRPSPTGGGSSAGRGPEGAGRFDLAGCPGSDRRNAQAPVCLRAKRDG